MNAVDYLKEKERMCNSLVCNCPMSKKNNGKGMLCESFEKYYTEKAVEIVENWAKENPVKTYLSVLLEKLPNATLNNSTTLPFICVQTLFGKGVECIGGMSCKQCWNREYKELENGN